MANACAMPKGTSTDNPVHVRLKTTSSDMLEAHPSESFNRQATKTPLQLEQASVTEATKQQERTNETRRSAPDQRHSGQAGAILARRRQVYEAAQRKHPERWTRPPRRWEAPDSVYLNPEDPLYTVTGSPASQHTEAVA